MNKKKNTQIRVVDEKKRENGGFGWCVVGQRTVCLAITTI